MAKRTNQTSHGANTPTHSRGRNIPDGNQSAPKPDRRARQTRLIQMISQLCCLIREKEHPLQSSADGCCCLWVFGAPDSTRSASGQMWSALEVLFSCFAVSSPASSLAWPPALLQGAERLEGGDTEASDSPVPAQSQTEEVTRQSRWPTQPEEFLQGALLLHQRVKEHTASFSPPSAPPTSCLLPLSDPASVSVLKFQKIKTTNRKYEHMEFMVSLCFTPLFSVSFLIFLTHSFPF